MSESLTDFLLARLAEDEAWLREYGRPRAHWKPSAGAPDDVTRMLADCEAKRRILERLDHALDENSKTPAGFASNEIFGLVSALHFLAIPYADHSDYRDGWRI